MPNEKKRVLLVSYDLNSAEKDYLKLVEMLKSDLRWWHYLDSTWLVVTTKTPQEFAAQIRPFLDQKKDRFLVIEVTPSYQGGLPRKAWEWMRSSFASIQSE